MPSISRQWARLIGIVLLTASLTPASDFRISGPHTQENLTIFLIHSSRHEMGAKLLTLQEAMEQKKVVVYETGRVNELSIENLSSDNVYIQAGDMVKGGQQDRVFPTDFLLTSHSGKVPIASFCVERGRWSKRGVEPEMQFSRADWMAPAKVKAAARDSKNQSDVWNEVSKAQAGLADAVDRMDVAPGALSGSGSRSVRAFVAPSTMSMQLALESNPVVDATAVYVENLANIVNGQNDVVGYAYVINGKLNSAEVYASNDLFRRMWPKLLKSSAAEAFTERGKAGSTGPDIEAVQQTLDSAESAPESSKVTKGRLSVTKKESGKMLLFETRNQDQDSRWIHRSYVVK